MAEAAPRDHIGSMAPFTKEKIQAEHRRHRKAAGRYRDRDVREFDANCIHCGRPFSSALAAAGKYGLCDDCHFKDDD